MEWLKRSFEPRRSEWPVLAGVRFLMALTVVVYHLPIVHPVGHVVLLEGYGGLGCICGFLAISGYSIAHSISMQPKRFFLRRAWRVLPIYYVAMGLSLLPYLFEKGLPPFRDLGFSTFEKSEVVGSIFLLQCFLTDKIPIFGPSWTLAIEWWLYVAAPLFIRLRPWMLWVLVGISWYAQKELLARGFFPVHIWRWGIPAVLLMWAWLSGFLFYRAPGWSAGLVVIAGFEAVARFPDFAPNAYLWAAVAVVTAKSLPPMPRVLGRVLNYLGDLSYPLYLVHVPLLAWTSRWTTWVDPYAYIGLALAVSAAFYHFVDAPLRHRFSTRVAEAHLPPPSESVTPARDPAPTVGAAAAPALHP